MEKLLNLPYELAHWRTKITSKKIEKDEQYKTNKDFHQDILFARTKQITNSDDENDEIEKKTNPKNKIYQYQVVTNKINEIQSSKVFLNVRQLKIYLQGDNK